MKGFLWYTNGEVEIQIKDCETPPAGFRRGRKPESNTTKQKKSASARSRAEHTTSEQYARRTEKTKQTKAQWSPEYKEDMYKRCVNHRKPREWIPWNKGKKGVQEAWNKGKHVGSNWNAESARRQFETRVKNGSFKTKDTSQESMAHQVLKTQVSETDIIHPYRDEGRYPFNCDFYIKSLDLFIEINAHWTHGKRPYNPEDPECQKQLLEWQEKAKTSQFYKNAIETWTVRDVKKLQVARENNLNYRVIYESSPTTIENILLEEISKGRSE